MQRYASEMLALAASGPQCPSDLDEDLQLNEGQENNLQKDTPPANMAGEPGVVAEGVSNSSQEDDSTLATPSVGKISTPLQTPDGNEGSIAFTEEIEGQSNDNEKGPLGTRERKIFVLCTYCVRMILIHCPVSPPLDFISTTTSSVIFVTVCRDCNRISALKTANQAGLTSRYMIEHTHIYDNACAIAGEKTLIVTRENTNFVENIPVGKLAEGLPVSARIQGVATRRQLPSSDEVPKENSIIPYLPGGFL